MSATTTSAAVAPTEAELRATWEARRHTFHRDARVASSALVRVALVVVGSALLVTGIVGAFVPILPTTPFVLAATACYVRASPRLYDRVLSHRVVGPVVFAWRETRTIPRRAKRVAIAVIVVTFATTLIFAVTILWARLLMGAMAVGLIAWIASIPSAPSAPSAPAPAEVPHA